MRFHKLEQHLIEYISEAEFALDVEAERISLDWLKSSQKFYIGEINNLPAIRKDFPVKDCPRLPFQICSFEFLGEFNDVVATHIVIGIEFEDNGEEHTLFHIFILTPDGNFHCPGATDINRTTGIATFNLDRNLKHQLTDDEKRALNKLALWKTSEIIRSLLVLNCVNVKTETVEAPLALNKKRTRNGKIPLYSYKVLVLKSSAARGTNQGGMHETPRIHLRRGHIKHRKTGDFWWQPCVVGDRKRGVVMKDYRADELAR